MEGELACYYYWFYYTAIRLRVVRVVSGCEAHDGYENKGIPVGEGAVACYYYYWFHYCCRPPEGSGESWL